jgi:hypothetical protein
LNLDLQGIFLNNTFTHIGLPALLGYGKVNHFEFMVMPLYGRTLKEIMLGQQSAEQRRFSLKTVCQIGLQLVKYFA